jgi:transcriptional regulator with XRE-family HTH domain
MIIGDQLRALREQQNLSQGDIEKRTGLLRCYVSRVENGHTIPSIETLEKWARALKVPLYQVFYEGNDSPSPQPLNAENLGSGSAASSSFSKPDCILKMLGASSRGPVCENPRTNFVELGPSRV